jgi:hypothetical protein
MSGGSYDYLCYATSLDELLAKRARLEEMFSRLSNLPEREFPGAAAAAALTKALLLHLQTWEVHAGVAIGQLAEVWKAVEWWDSCDYGPDQVAEALAEYVSAPPV